MESTKLKELQARLEELKKEEKAIREEIDKLQSPKKKVTKAKNVSNMNKWVQGL